ncbi:sensor histidine kinase [Polymorphospora rubra]|uniref:sensor histidine kinase n=1 Tax=Polymorphospora rubra TaxID=338584 RepID=UPI001BB404A0|nr:histidine kinase [Polymorphospora rubra]
MASSPSIGSVGASRQDAAAVLAVGGLGVMTGALYLWAIHTLITAAAAPGISALWTYAVFVVVNTLTAGLLWWHRRHPLVVFGGVLLVFVASSLMLGHAGNGGLTLPLWFSVYAVASYAPLRTALVTVSAGWVLSVAVKLGLAIGSGQQIALPAVGLVALDLGFFFVACFALGFGFRLQRQRARDAAERARLIEERSRALNAEAVARERNRLARDLHDLAAHEVMDVLLSIRALRMTSDDPILPEVEQKTARALDNMRTVVRTLREEDRDGPDRAPLQDAARDLIDTLVTEREITVDAHIRVPAHVGDAAASTTLSVLKEALLNADTHAPGRPVTVDLDADGGSVRLTVTNPTGNKDMGDHSPPAEQARPLGTGYGLIGAAERAGLLGGRFKAAPAPNGDWLVSLHLPSSARTDQALVTGETP